MLLVARRAARVVDGTAWACRGSFQRQFSSSSDPKSPLEGLDAPGAFRPRRALLYMPADDEKKVTKAASSIDVDVVCMDCEDAVAANKKADARSRISNYLECLDFGRSERAVRINPLGSGHADADLEAALTGTVLPDAIVIPKVGSPVDLQTLVPKVKKLIGHRTSGLSHSGEPVKLITMCESAMGLLNLRQVFDAALHLGLLGHKGVPLRLEACILGGDDFAASVGATRSTGSQELLYARQCFLTHCHAYGVQPIDIVQVLPASPLLFPLLPIVHGSPSHGLRCYCCLSRCRTDKLQGPWPAAPGSC
mmetsp:Transcript_22570/g.62656  ORF Transcript_22570/g.62656 Transcript_22570/m.62656 type:complete len:308 (-) Transcript_22570:438-1361(-)